MTEMTITPFSARSEEAPNFGGLMMDGHLEIAEQMRQIAQQYPWINPLHLRFEYVWMEVDLEDFSQTHSLEEYEKLTEQERENLLPHTLAWVPNPIED